MKKTILFIASSLLLFSVAAQISFKITPFGAANILYVQYAGTSDAASTNHLQVTLTNSATAGNCIVVAVTGPDAGGTTTSVVDSLANTYTLAAQTNGANWWTVSVWYATNIAAGACTIHITNSALTTFSSFSAHEFSGVKLVAAKDQSELYYNVATENNHAVGPITPTVDKSLVFYAQNCTDEQATFPVAWTDKGRQRRLHTQYQVQAVAAAITATATNATANSINAVVVSFKPN
jgi:hypothetical protein